MNCVPDSSKLTGQPQSGSSKFLNRALPPTPKLPPATSDVTTHANGDASEEIYSDLIEEEDVNATSNGNVSPRTQLLTSSRETSVHARSSLFSGGATHSRGSSFSYLADYLEPTDHSLQARPTFIKPNAATNAKTYNSPYSDCNGVRGARNGNGTVGANGGAEETSSSAASSETYVSMIYVNTEMILHNTKPPQDVAEGFRCMAFVNVESLLHVANRIQSQLIHQDADIDRQLKFSHFVLKNTQPYVNQGVVAFYNARTYKLAPSDCFLMVSAFHLIHSQKRLK